GQQASSFYLIPLPSTPALFGLLRGILRTGMGEGRPPSPALSAVSAMCCCSWRALPSFSSSGVSSEQSRVPNHRLGALPFVLSYRNYDMIAYGGAPGDLHW